MKKIIVTIFTFILTINFTGFTEELRRIVPPETENLKEQYCFMMAPPECSWLENDPEALQARCWYQMPYASSTLYPDAKHWVKEITFYGDHLTLNDGSYWGISPDQEGIVLEWLVTDKIFVCRSQASNPIYKYLLWNSTSEQIVEAELCLTPYKNGLHTHYYVEKTNSDQLFILEDGSCWLTYDNDEGFLRPLALKLKLNDWDKGDIIIVGLNSNPADNDRRPYLLLNASKNQSITANLLR